jgi:hypothetical protein
MPPFFSQEWFHDFPDRAHRQLLLNLANLAELVGRAAPTQAADLDVGRAALLDRELPLPDWRRRQVDLLFEIPFRDRPQSAPAILCLVLEHQSAEDQAMPLRMLLEAVLYWERRWGRWQNNRRRGDLLRLPVVLPLVFHTGPQPWESPRTLSHLFDVPEPYRTLIPTWEPIFWDLAALPPEELLAASGEWLKAMAVVRSERADRETFGRVLTDVMTALEPLAERDKMRWHELLWFLLSYAANCRPPAERADHLAAAVASQHVVALREEVRFMSEQVAETWQDWARRHYTELGRKEGRLMAWRETLRGVLEERFGPLPQSVLDRIAAVEDDTRLQTAVRRAPHLPSLDALEL